MKKLILLAALLPNLLRAETGREGWLRYAPVPAADRIQYASLPAAVVGLGDSASHRPEHAKK